jgi:hypothetical protein
MTSKELENMDIWFDEKINVKLQRETAYQLALLNEKLDSVLVINKSYDEKPYSIVRTTNIDGG